MNNLDIQNKRLCNTMEMYGKEVEYLLTNLIGNVNITKSMEICTDNEEIKGQLGNVVVNRIEDYAVHSIAEDREPHFVMQIRCDGFPRMNEQLKIGTEISKWMKSKKFDRFTAKLILYNGQSKGNAWTAWSDTIEIRIPATFKAAGIDSESIADYIPEMQ